MVSRSPQMTAQSEAAAETLPLRRLSDAEKPRRVLIIVENLPSPFDRRVWQEATTLVEAGYEVSIVCPTGKGHDARYEQLDGVHIYRYQLPFEAGSKLGYAIEYPAALLMQL